ncbi:MAG: alpha-hydroxy-acid oxidizing protein, partial [Phyllobacterium sp.]|nr:alpha-hydroxy-acid oxidizing protein [Phyllobacterium sp.]
IGAKGTFIGRAFLYGLGAGGKQGVTQALEIIRNELDVTMALCGERDVKNLDRNNLYKSGLETRPRAAAPRKKRA